jgi:hypothetical protein
LDEWYNFESGDSVCAADRPGAAIEQVEILRRVAAGFQRVNIDWTEGDRWVERRIVKAVEVGYGGFLLEAEHALRGRSVLVSVADTAGSDAVWLRFYMTPDTGGFELNYRPASATSAGRVLAIKLAELLGYEFTPWEKDEKAGQ